MQMCGINKDSQHIARERLANLGFSAQDIQTVCTHPGWTPSGMVEHCELLDQIPGFQGEKYAREHFFEANPELKTVFQEPQASVSAIYDGILSHFQTLDQFEQKDVEWLVNRYIVKGQINLLGSDGGIGKTSIWVHLAASISSGAPTFLGNGLQRPGKVLFLSTEDSVRAVLKGRLRVAGAIEKNIIAPDYDKDEADDLNNVKFGSKELECILKAFQPDLCIFDPIQGFIPKGTRMVDRAAMRACLAPLVSWGERYGTTFLLNCHTNKRKGASGRERLADSADLWDIARSVLMVGWTEEDGVRYLSHEKCNYGELQETILFTIDDDGLINTVGSTWKRDREYMSQREYSEKNLGNRPKLREECKTWILRMLEEHGGKMQTQELDKLAEKYHFSEGTLKRAKAELHKAQKIQQTNTGYAERKMHFTELTSTSVSVRDIELIQ